MCWTDIPAELRAVDHWVVWKLEDRTDTKTGEIRKTKVPYQTDGHLAQSTNPDTWTSFDAALAAADRFSGIGFVFADDDPYVGLDLDKVRDPATGTVLPWAKTLIKQFASYAELSPSGTGVHIICRGALPGGGINRHYPERDSPTKLELYDKGKYFTMTGQFVSASRYHEIQSVNGPLVALYEQIEQRDQPVRPAPPRSLPAGGAPGDWDVVQKVLEHPEAGALWRGDDGPFGSASEADLALANHVTYFVGPDIQRIEAILRLSDRWREKWDKHRTYLLRTIEKGFVGRTSYYEWPRSIEVSSYSSFRSFTDTHETAPQSARPLAPAVVDELALPGLIGDLVHALAEQSEAAPVAILASMLIGAGAMIGPRPHVRRDGGRLTTNDFALLVGMSAHGRKGTATRRAAGVLRRLPDPCLTNRSQHDIFGFHAREDMEARPSFFDLIQMNGLGSGEAMVEALADPNADRRALIVEEEFARCIKAMRRENSTLSETLRAAWDGTVIANRTKGRHLRAAGHHVAILGHITEEELKSELSGPSLYNGFANRFLWLVTRRTRLLPMGGEEPAVAALVRRLNDALQAAARAERLEFDGAARELWVPDDGLYARLTNRPPGLIGAVTSRAEVHVTRLALLYALLDGAAAIRREHLMAALAVWDYSERSAAYLFGASSGDDTADRIEELLASVAPGGYTGRQIHDALYRNAPPGAVRTAQALLLQQGKVAVQAIGEGPGRRAQLWSLVPLEDRPPLVGVGDAFAWAKARSSGKT